MFSSVVNIYHHRELLLTLVSRELKARSKQAFLGYFWVVVQPLLATGLFSVLVQAVLRLNLSETPYPVFLMVAMIPWQFFVNGVTAGTESLVTNIQLIRQVYFPREILVLYPMVVKLVEALVSVVGLIILMFIFHVPVAPTALFVLALLPVQLVLMTGLALGFAPLNVAFRDVSRILPVLLGFFMYAVPVLYPVNQVPERFRTLFMLNPMAVLIEGYRNAVLYGGLPEWHWYLGAFGISLLVLLVAHALFGAFEAILADII